MLSKNAQHTTTQPDGGLLEVSVNRILACPRLRVYRADYFATGKHCFPPPYVNIALQHEGGYVACGNR